MTSAVYWTIAKARSGVGCYEEIFCLASFCGRVVEQKERENITLSSL